MSRVVYRNSEAVKAFAVFAKLGGISEDPQGVRRSLDATISADDTMKSLRRGEHTVLHELSNLNTKNMCVHP